MLIQSEGPCFWIEVWLGCVLLRISYIYQSSISSQNYQWSLNQKVRRKCQTEWRLSCPVLHEVRYPTSAPGCLLSNFADGIQVHVCIRWRAFLSLIKRIHYDSKDSAFVIPRVYRF